MAAKRDRLRANYGTNRMTIYSFWIYDRHCNCIYSREYAHSNKTAHAQRTASVSINSTRTISTSENSGVGAQNSTGAFPGTVHKRNEDNVSKFLFGICFSLRKIANSITRDGAGAGATTATDGDASFDSNILNNGNRVRTFATLNYKCHLYETLTGLKMIVVTDMQCRELGTELVNLFNTVYIRNVVENSACPVEFRSGEYIENPVFTEGVDSYWSNLVEFK